MISCLRRAGAEVVERHEPVWETTREAWRAGAQHAFALARAEARLLRRRQGSFDVVVVGYPGHFDLPAAKRLGAPVVFNPLISLSDTLVGDRARFRPGSLRARALELVDRRALRAADTVVADTRAHAEFLRELGGLSRVEVCFVGAEERVFGPEPTPSRFTHALFVGKLIPLHGLETILAAAALAPELSFRIVGNGQLAHLLTRRPANVEWVEWVDYEALATEHHRAGVALGIFGTSAKAARVIPNKVFQALACGTAVVTGDTGAARELLANDRDALLVPVGDPVALAATVRRLAADDALRRRIAEGGLAAYRAQASEDVLGRRWLEVIELTLGG